jgi:hypothetical protein
VQDECAIVRSKLRARVPTQYFDRVEALRLEHQLPVEALKIRDGLGTSWRGASARMMIIALCISSRSPVMDELKIVPPPWPPALMHISSNRQRLLRCRDCSRAPRGPAIDRSDPRLRRSYDKSCCAFHGGRRTGIRPDDSGSATAFRALLGDRRMRVLADPERDHGFRVEGLFELPLETQIARLQEEAGRFKKLVAGARSVQVPMGSLAIPFAA